MQLAPAALGFSWEWGQGTQCKHFQDTPTTLSDCHGSQPYDRRCAYAQMRKPRHAPRPASPSAHRLRMKTSQGSIAPAEPHWLPPQPPSSKARQGTERAANIVAQKAHLSPSSSSQVEEVSPEGPHGSPSRTLLTRGIGSKLDTAWAWSPQTAVHTVALPIAAHEGLGKSTSVPDPSSLGAFIRGDDAQLPALPGEFQTVPTVGMCGQRGLVNQSPASS